MAVRITVGTLLCIMLAYTKETPALPSLSVRAEPAPTPTCTDSPVCSQVAEICNGPDRDLIKSLCPVKCGFCDDTTTTTPTTTSTSTTTTSTTTITTATTTSTSTTINTTTNTIPNNSNSLFSSCKDSTNNINCTEVRRDVCSMDLAFSVCPRTCGLCDQIVMDPGTTHPPCDDRIDNCASLASPCGNNLGKLACARFCGVCPSATVTIATVPSATSTTAYPPPTTQKSACDNMPCLNGGTCRALSDGAFECSCSGSFGGPFCERDMRTTATTTATTTPARTTSVQTTSGGSDKCTVNPCLNGGTCKLTSDGGFSCACPDGFTGSFCLIAVTTSAPTSVPTTQLTTAPTTASTTAPTTAPSATACAKKPCLNGGTCEDLPGGRFTCRCPPGFGGMFCLPVAMTTSAPVTDATGCDLLDKEQLVSGNAPADVIFLVETSRIDSACDIDNEGDFIKNWIDAHNVDQDKNIRVGVIFYSADINAEITTSEFKGDKRGLKDRISEFTGTCSPFVAGTVKGEGRADLARVLDHARGRGSFRPGVARVFVPIMHQMSGNKVELEEIPKAAQRLKDMACTSVVGIAVKHSTLDWNIVTQSVSQPYGDHLFTKESFKRLEYSPLSCNLGPVTKSSLGCDPAEVVFMIEYGRTDTQCDVDHEGDFIRALVDKWLVDEDHIRIGVVAYHDTVQEFIHIDDFKNDKQGLKDRILALTGTCSDEQGVLIPSGDSDLGKALDFVRENSFKNARPGVPHVVVPIVHNIAVSNSNPIVAAGQKLKDVCTSVIALRVATAYNNNQAQANIVHQLVSQDTSTRGSYVNYYGYYNDFQALESYGQRLGTDGNTCSSRR